MNPQKHILITRHGATAYNDQDLLQGLIDNGLSERGIEQAELLAERLKHENIDVIFHSPLLRARQTTEIVNRFHRTKLESIKAFTEMDMGTWEGLNLFDVIKEKPDIYQKWLTDPETGVPGGESFTQVFSRVQPGVKKILKAEEKHILIVAHAMVNRAILGNLLEMHALNARRFRTRNCSLSKLTVFETKDGNYIGVDTWNSTDHLIKR